MVKKISVQGEITSFHHLAALEFFKEDFELIACDSFASTCQKLVSGESDYAVCAIENSLYGSINEVYDLLLQNKLWIIGEEYLRIDQCLIGVPGTKLSDIKEVYSHPVALAQCKEYLATKLPKAEKFEYYDTAASVVVVKQAGQKSKAAIGSKESAKLHNLSILASNIETNKQNYTRFVVLSKYEEYVELPDKTSLILETSHETGALYRALGSFAKRGINLTKLQSRPIIGRAWHYIFYTDAAVGFDKSEFKQAIADLKSQGCQVTIIGSYRAQHRNR
jgi:prephenate dehydratase